MTDFADLVPSPDRPLRRHRPPLCAGRGRAAARLGPDRAQPRPPRRQSPVGAAASGGLCPRARRGHRQSGDADGPRRVEGDLSLRLAGRRRRQHRRRHVSRPVALSGQCRARAVPPDQPHPAARRPDRAYGRRRQARLVRADHRRCRSRLRRALELLRDHEGLYRGRRRRRPFRGPARRRKEVRPSRRQGADPDPGPYPQSRCRAAGSRRLRRAHHPGRAHRRRKREADHLGRRRARP